MSFWSADDSIELTHFVRMYNSWKEDDKLYIVVIIYLFYKLTLSNY